MQPNPYQKYKEQSLNTMSSGEILVKLFDECIKQLHIAGRAIPVKDYAATSEALSKAQEIIDTLSVSLDMKVPLSQNLRSLYFFISQQITKANLTKDAEIVTEILPLVRELRISFDEAQRTSRQQMVGGYAR